MLETSKSFAVLFIKFENKFNIKLNPDYIIIMIKKLIETNTYDKKFVIKQDILAGGKGVLVMDEHFKTNKEGVKMFRLF